MTKVSIHEPDIHHTWGITMHSDDPEKIRSFVKACRTKLSRELGAFHQSGLQYDGSLASYQYFEFLRMYDTKKISQLMHIYAECVEIAESVGEELKNTVNILSLIDPAKEKSLCQE